MSAPETLLLSALLFSTTAMATAQSPRGAARLGGEPPEGVIFRETFRAGIAGWETTISGAVIPGEPITFHPVTTASLCMGSIAPFPSPGAVRAGREEYCDFETFGYIGETTVTTLTMVDRLELPSGASDLRLAFWSYDDVECGSCQYDKREVYIEDEAGDWIFLGESTRLLGWYQVSFDVTPWAGQSVRIRFRFDTGDGIGNQGLGWIVGDVRVTEGWSTVQRYCTAAPNSVTGDGATLGYVGSTSVGAADFTVTLDGAPASSGTHFFYGPSRNYLPAKDGFLCVGLGATGHIMLTPGVPADPGGHAEYPVDIEGSLSTPGWITAGSTWNFQAFYRDTAAGRTGWNYSDALQVTFSE